MKKFIFSLGLVGLVFAFTATTEAITNNTNTHHQHMWYGQTERTVQEPEPLEPQTEHVEPERTERHHDRDRSSETNETRVSSTRGHHARRMTNRHCH